MQRIELFELTESESTNPLDQAKQIDYWHPGTQLNCSRDCDGDCDWRSQGHYRHRHHHRLGRPRRSWQGGGRQVTVTMRRRAVAAVAVTASFASSAAAAIGTLGILCRFTCKQSRYAGLSSDAMLGPESEPGARAQHPRPRPGSARSGISS